MLKAANFIDALKNYMAADDVLNPWGEYTDEYDIGEDAPKIRREQFQRFLEGRLESARFLFVAEAMGYQGGRFSGIPMTSERIVTGHHPDVDCSHVFTGEAGIRTSNPECSEFKKAQSELGFSEQTATIIWKAILEHEINPYEIILWNIFPFHPFDKSKGLLSNRTPRETELEEGISFLKKLLDLCPKQIQIICIGQQSKKMLDQVGMACSHLEHPSKGGVRKFREGFAEMFAFQK